jgi:hypothetical protein
MLIATAAVFAFGEKAGQFHLAGPELPHFCLEPGIGNAAGYCLRRAIQLTLNTVQGHDPVPICETLHIMNNKP